MSPGRGQSSSYSLPVQQLRGSPPFDNLKQWILGNGRFLLHQLQGHARK